MEVLTTTADENFGGRDLDKVIYDLILAKLTPEAQQRVSFTWNKTAVF